MIRWPGINEWLFAVKTFAAAMLAFYIASSIGLIISFLRRFVTAEKPTCRSRSRDRLGGRRPERYGKLLSECRSLSEA